MERHTAWSVVDTDTNAAVQASKAGVTNRRHAITGISISASAAPAATAVVTVKDGSTVLLQFNLPAAAFSPLFIPFPHPLLCTSGSAATLDVAALGSGVVCNGSIHGFTIYGG